jgi:hypothetical protein
MFPYKKNLALEQYQKTIFTNIFTSNFVYSNIQEIPRVRRLRLNIKTKKSKKVHSLYLFLLTGQIPYIRKFYPSWKNSNSQASLKPKKLTDRVQICVRPRNKLKILSEIVTQLITKQLPHETRIWRFQGAKMLILVPMASLMKSTASLQGKNNYFPNFPLTMQITFPNMTAFQKLFFIRSLRIVTAEQKIKGLDLFE